ncbi:MAG TPA: molybdopterin cofactor-binding domain-containing protein [Casimicrobiaceae bacterium]|nr:molybdopterin cofactor-binding domain-containing protein [Casimicrobiaceae bacterium]
MIATVDRTRRALLKAGGALIVALEWGSPAWSQVATGAGALPGKSIKASDVDAFFAVHRDSSVTLYCGKVDLGQGLRVAIRQMAAEELGVPIDRIAMIEGDTALTPDQGPTAGSSGVMRGGVQIRQAAATARQALLGIGAQKLGRPASELTIADGRVMPKGSGEGIDIGALIGDQRFSVPLDAKAPLRDPMSYTVVGLPLPRPDLPAKVTGRHVYVHDFTVPNMLHGRVLRPGAVGANVVSIDDRPLKAIPGARVVRIANFIGVVAPDEWNAVRAARAVKVTWSPAETLIGNAHVAEWLRAGPFISDEALLKRGDVASALAGAEHKRTATYYWPLQTHGSMGPSCAVADVRTDRATIWTASQATHKFVPTFAAMLGLPPAAVRLIYLDGAGCYGMNGHDDAAADAALLSKAVGRPVRVQWMREDEHGWDPKGPPQLLALEGAVTAEGGIAAWRTQMWIPRATANLPNVPLLGPQDAGIEQPRGISTGLISQNGDPPYAASNVEVTVHWLKDSPLRPSNIRAPGKIANLFAVEAFTDELAQAAAVDPVEFRLRGLNDRRGIEVIKRTTALFDWQPQAKPRTSFDGRGRGFAYAHYKHNETYVAMAMEVSVDRGSGAIHVHRVACAHDCGLIINPDALKAQIEGNILQTLSRTLYEEVRFDRERVTSLDWHSYPILRFAEVPEIRIDLIERRNEPPLGAGEASAVTVPGALANAVFDATGVRLRTVPFTPERVKAAIVAGNAPPAG